MIPGTISEYLDRHQARYSLLSHPTAYTAQEEAAAAHIAGLEWAKTVVCIADGHPLLAVVPAPFAVDLSRLQLIVHARALRLATEKEFAPLYQDCELGAMPPLGPLYGQPVVIDERLARDPEVAFSAGSHHDTIRMPYAEFERLVHPIVADIASLSSASPSPRTRTMTDPVCGEVVQADVTSAWKSEHRGETYYFCSQCCKMEFDDNPYAYADR
jgi:Ala-tRNA(Pro) deacylase